MPRADLFLAVESARSGAVNGESADAAHPNEIELLDWSWGMRAQATTGAPGSAQRTALNELRVVKRPDLATTSLMSIMRSNDRLSSATLTVRKSGGEPIDYLVLSIGQGRITSYELGGGAEPSESLTIAFETIEVQYYPQLASGARGSASTFSASAV